MSEGSHQAPPHTGGQQPDGAATPRKSGGSFSGAIAVMRQKSFRDFTIGSTSASLGVWLQRVATGWLTWELTETPSWLGIIAFTDLFIMILVAPLGGVIADRINRLMMLHVAQIIVCVQAAITAVIYGMGWMTIEVLLALTVLSGIGHGAHGAARLSLIPNLVPKALLTQAIAVNALCFNTARFLGPALAGLVIAFGSLTWAFAFNAATHILFSLLLLRVRVATPDAPRAAKAGVFAELVEGCRYAAVHPGIGPILVMMLLTAFTIRALPDLLPAFAATAFDGGAQELAWLTSAMGLGAALGGLKMAHLRGIEGLTRGVTWNVAFLSLVIAALALSPNLWLGMVAACGCGFALTINGTGTQTLIQSSVDGALRGRVMGVFTLIYQGAPAIGALSLGVIADHVGVRWPFLGGALVCLLVFGWMMRRAHRMSEALEVGRSLQRGHGHHAAPAESATATGAAPAPKATSGS